jgi:hypothetical protein
VEQRLRVRRSRGVRLFFEQSYQTFRSAPPIPNGLGGGEAERDRREQPCYNCTNGKIAENNKG